MDRAEEAFFDADAAMDAITVTGSRVQQIDIVDANFAAIDAAVARLKRVEVPREVTSSRTLRDAVPAGAPACSCGSTAAPPVSAHGAGNC